MLESFGKKLDSPLLLINKLQDINFLVRTLGVKHKRKEIGIYMYMYMKREMHRNLALGIICHEGDKI